MCSRTLKLQHLFDGFFVCNPVFLLHRSREKIEPSFNHGEIVVIELAPILANGSFDFFQFLGMLSRFINYAPFSLLQIS